MRDPPERWTILDVYNASPRQRALFVASVRRYTIRELRYMATYTHVILLASNRSEPDTITVFDYREYPYIEQKFNDLLTAQAFARMRV